MLTLAGSGAPEGSTATTAFTLSGALSAALKAKLPPCEWTTMTHGQTFCTSASYAACVAESFVAQRGTPCLPNWSNASTGNCVPGCVLRFAGSVA